MWRDPVSHRPDQSAIAFGPGQFAVTVVARCPATAPREIVDARPSRDVLGLRAIVIPAAITQVGAQWGGSIALFVKPLRETLPVERAVSLIRTRERHG